MIPKTEERIMRTTNEEELYELVRIGVWKIDREGRIWEGKKQIGHKNPQGYLQARKMINGIRLHTGVHRLVYRHFHGKIPKEMTINHKNGIKDDNRPENLEIATYSENMKHAFRTGLKEQWGETNPAAILSDKQVKEIREIYNMGGITQKKLGEMFGAAHQTISKIVRGERRKQNGGKTGDYTHRRNHPNKNRDQNGRFTK